MKTFTGKISMDFKVVVPDSFLAAQREACQAEDATPFQKQLQAAHPTNDDAFLEALLSNGIRKYTRNALCEELYSVGLGATLSPATIDIVAKVPDHDAAPAQPQLVLVKAA
jgi:hypothetical protein